MRKKLLIDDTLPIKSNQKFFASYRNELTYLFLALANSLFVWKYSGRYGFPYAGVVYFVLLLVVTNYFSAPNMLVQKLFRKRNLVWFMLFMSLFAAIVVLFLPVHTRVARLFAIVEWLDRLNHGEFPYGGPMNPSGFPMLFIIASPFYYLGNLGFLEVVGILLFGILILKEISVDNLSSIRFLILSFLPIVYYEIITRSELFFNMSLALTIVVLADKYIDGAKIGWKFLSFAIAFGLVLSTRLIVAPLYTIFVIYKFKSDLMKGLIFSAVVIFVFALTLVPFFVWNSTEFISAGPFRMQFAYLPKWGVIAAFLASLIFGFKSREVRDVSAFAGITIFFSVALAFAWAVYQIGITQVISKDGFDIGYFILSVPFLLYGINLKSAQSSLPEPNS